MTSAVLAEQPLGLREAIITTVIIEKCHTVDLLLAEQTKKKQSKKCILCFNDPMKSASTFVSFTFELIYNTIQKCGVSKIKKKKSLILLLSKDALKCSKVTVKAFIMLRKMYVSNNCSFELFIRQIMYHSFHKIY